ncbi:Biotin--[acetyl-CoA-carboxylase] ligase [Diplonema papillatum]|nr:Biotin--[acetyl-CoA-carboxylase] ligase [Diplonema papillatum]|eukprot:gene2717-4228_t
MDAAKEQCRRPELAGRWFAVLADQQRDGRGTAHRPWHSRRGNLHASICVPKSGDAVTPRTLPFLPLETGLSVLLSIEEHKPPDSPVKALPESAAPDCQLAVKWPNDVLLGQKKVSGSLIEDGGTHMIVGIGVNIVEAPVVSDGGRATCCLADHRFEVTAPQLGLRILENLKAALCLRRGAAVVPLYAARIDWQQRVHERGPDGSRGAAGMPVRLTKDGHLVIAQRGKEKTLVHDYLY